MPSLRFTGMMAWRAAPPSPAGAKAAPALPALVAAAGDRAQLRFLEFFAAQIRNPHTRRAYARAVGDFLAWCETHGAASLGDVRPLHVATWIEARAEKRTRQTRCSSCFL